MNWLIPGNAAGRLCAVPLFVLCALLVSSVFGWIVQHPVQRARIEATLDSPITNVKGFTWLVGEDGVVYDTFVSQEPSEVRVTFPSGRVWKTTSRFTVVDQRDTLVCRLLITPDHEAMLYARCVARVEEILGELGVGSSAPAFQVVERWKSVPEDEQRLICDIEDGIELCFDIKSTYERAEPRKWYVSCEFSVSRLYLH